MKTKNKKNSFLRPRWRKVFSDLWVDKTRTMLVVASITVGVFAIGMVVTAFSILGEDINISYESENPANIEIWTDPFSENLRRVVEIVPGVEEVESRFAIEVRTRKSGEFWQNVTLIGIDDFTDIRISQISITEGYPYPNKNEVLISRSFINNTGYQVGDVIEIDVPNGSIESLTVVGLVTDQANASPDPNSSANTFVTNETIRSFGLGKYDNRLLVTVEGSGGDEEIITKIAEEVENRVERHGMEVYKMDENLSTTHPMQDTLLAIIGVLGALGLLITILSSSLIINMLNSLLTQQLRQIGVMKLVGGRSKQILGMYVVLIFVYSLITIIIAIPLGAAAGNALARLIAYMTGAVLQGSRIVPMAVSIQVLIAVLVPIVAGFFPINRGARVNVRRAINNYRPEAKSSKRKTFLSNWKGMQRMPRPMLLSFRNTFRKKGQLLLTIFALTIAGSVFMSVFNSRASMDNMLDEMLRNFVGDVTLNFNRPYKAKNIERILSSGIPGISAIEGWGGARAEIWGENDEIVTRLSISAPPQDTELFKPKLLTGRWLLPNERKALFISDTIYNFYPEIKPGDMLTIKIDGNYKEDWEIVGVFPFVNIIENPIAYANFDYVGKKVGTPYQATTFKINGNGSDSEELAWQIDRYLDDRGYDVASVETGASLRDSASNGINTLILFLLIMAILTAVVGSIGLTGTMSINVLERTREIGVMRTIGAVDKKIMFSVIVEALVIGLITWVLAIGFSFPISTALLQIIGETMAGSPVLMVFNPLGVFVWLGVVVILSIIASIMPARKAARLTIREVLAYE